MTFILYKKKKGSTVNNCCDFIWILNTLKSHAMGYGYLIHRFQSCLCFLNVSLNIHRILRRNLVSQNYFQTTETQFYSIETIETFLDNRKFEWKCRQHFRGFFDKWLPFVWVKHLRNHPKIKKKKMRDK